MNDTTQVPSPPAWSLQTGTLGQTLVIAAVVLFAVALLASLAGAKVKPLAKVSNWAFGLGNVAILATFACLAALFIANRFEYEYVWSHADSKNPIAYRLAGVWSGQEGSFLLWASCAAVFSLAVVSFTRKYRRWFTVATSTFLGSIAGILAFESPFNLNMVEGKPFVPAEGFGLAPSLQNYWVTIHPPVIFLGFGSLTVLFALAVAALAEKDYDTWIPIVRPWAIVATTLTGLGLCMGGFWAYETLGWGGYWMWDPVENVSFVPWLFSIALIHGVIVQAAKHRWKMTNLLLAGLPFLLFVYGTFLTRSGFLSDTSVHSFAEMDSSALKILIGVMAGTVIGFGALWGVRTFQSRTKSEEPNEKGINREALYFYGIWALVLTGLATLVGMSVPLVMALRGQQPAVVPESLYHQVMPYVFVPLMVLMAVTPFVSWKRSSAREFWGKVYGVGCIAIGITGLALFATVVTGAQKSINLAPQVTMFGKFQTNGLAWLLFLTALCSFTVVANVWRAAELFKRSKLGTAGFLSHIGVALLMSGLVLSRGFEARESTMGMADHPAAALGMSFDVKGITLNDRDRDNQLLIDVSDQQGKKLFTAKPGLYVTTMGDGQDSTMVWPHIQRGLLMDTYIALGQPQTSASQEVTLLPGKTVMFGEMSLTYEEMVVDGQFGQGGTKFGAKIKVGNGDATKVIVPKMAIGPGGEVESHPALLDTNLNLNLLGINASDKSATLRVDLTTPMYPIEVFHKPLTNLVYLGTLIMTVAGIMAAWYRKPPNQRRSKQNLVEEISSMGEPIPQKPLTHGKKS